MRKEVVPAVVIEAAQRLPKVLGPNRELLRPVGMPLRERDSRRVVGKPRRGTRQSDVARLDVQTCLARAAPPVERLQRQGMQQGEQRGVGIAG